MRVLAFIGLLMLGSGVAQAQGTAAVGTVPGSVWTYLGPTFGADWVYSPISGGITPKSVQGYYYIGTQPAATVGTVAVPSVEASAVFAVEKHFSTPATQGTSPTGPWQHPALYSVCHLRSVGTDTNNNACRGAMAEGVDYVGGFGTFVEGGKFVGVSVSTSGVGGGAYGVVGWGQSYNAQYTIGIESQTVRTNGPDAPGPRLFNPNTQLLVGFLHSNGVGGVGKRADVGFLVNPFNPVKTSTGFACGNNTIEASAGVCFGDYGGAAIGIDLSLGSGTVKPHLLGAMLISNTDPILFHRTTGCCATGIFMGADDRLHIGGFPGDTINVNIEADLVVGGALSVLTNFNMQKIAGPAGAPGAGFGRLVWLAGTTAGTCKLVALAGTSATEVTIADNVGSGC